MSLFNTPELHAANPPESWEVQKVRPGLWALVAEGTDAECAGDQIETFPTKREAQAARIDGWSARLWRREAHWYNGGNVAGWKSWAVCKAEQERNAARWAK